MDEKTEESVNRIRSVLGFEQSVITSGASEGKAPVKPKQPMAAQNTKMEVLMSSMAVFARKGVSETTVQNLLDAAKISRRTFYKYFKNKVDVLENIYKVSIDLLITRFQSEMSQAQSISEIVTRCVDVYFDYHVDLGPIIRLMQEEAMRSDSPLAPHRFESQKAIVGVFETELMRLKRIRIDPWAFYAIVWAVENASLHLLTDTPCAAEDVTRCKNVMRAYIGSILIFESEDRPPMPLAPENDALFN